MENEDKNKQAENESSSKLETNFHEEDSSLAQAISNVNLNADEEHDQSKSSANQADSKQEETTQNRVESEEKEEIQQEKAVNEESGDEKCNEEEAEATTKKDSKKRKDPATIPRKGYFFEHDDRDGEKSTNTLREKTNSDRTELTSKQSLTASREPGPVKPEINNNNRRLNRNKNNNRNRKERHNSENNDRWLHDRFDQNEQKPKSRQEIIKRYGYDIRETSELNQSLPAEETRKTDHVHGKKNFASDSSKNNRNAVKNPVHGNTKRFSNNYDEDENDEEDDDEEQRNNLILQNDNDEQEDMINLAQLRRRKINNPNQNSNNNNNNFKNNSNQRNSANTEAFFVNKESKLNQPNPSGNTKFNRPKNIQTNNFRNQAEQSQIISNNNRQPIRNSSNQNNGNSNINFKSRSEPNQQINENKPNYSRIQHQQQQQKQSEYSDMSHNSNNNNIEAIKHTNNNNNDEKYTNQEMPKRYSSIRNQRPITSSSNKSSSIFSNVGVPAQVQIHSPIMNLEQQSNNNYQQQPQQQQQQTYLFHNNHSPIQHQQQTQQQQQNWPRPITHHMQPPQTQSQVIQLQQHGLNIQPPPGLSLNAQTNSSSSSSSISQQQQMAALINNQLYYMQPNDYVAQLAAQEYAAAMAVLQTNPIYFTNQSLPPPQQQPQPQQQPHSNPLSPMSQLQRQSKAIPIINPHQLGQRNF